MKRLYIIIITIILFNGCILKTPYDLAIINGSILDVKTGERLINKNIFIRKGIIEIISDKIFESKNTIDAKGKLVTPGFIDTHIHPTDIFGDYERAPKFLPEDSLEILHKKLSDEYLPYGTTTVITMGQPENWIRSMLKWGTSTSNRVDLIISGGALISKENRIPYIAHTEVTSPLEAKKKVLEYYSLGIKHLKLYLRLKEPEFSTILKTADSLGIKTYGHIGDFNPEYLKINYALKAGLRNFEHIVTIPNSIITNEEDRKLLNENFNKNYGEMDSEAKVIAFFLEQFRFIKEHKANELDSFIKQLSAEKASVSTTIHRVYEQISPSCFSKKPKDTLATPKQFQRSIESFAIVMKVAKQMQNNGIALRLGSDMANGGKANISELNIFAQYGFDIATIFKMASYNGAKAFGIDHEVGSVEQSKKANLIIWEKNPFENYQNFNSKMTVIKGGKVYK